MQHLKPVLDIVEDAKKSSRQELLLWKNPKATGLVFGAGLFPFLVIYFLDYDLITLGARLFQLFMVGAFVGSYLKVQVPEKDKESLQALLGQHIDNLREVVVQQGSEALLVVNRVVRWEDKVLSVKVLLASFVVSWILSFGILFLAFLAWVGAFALPVAHDKFKDHPAVQQAKDQVAKVLKSVPGAAKALGLDQKKTE